MALFTYLAAIACYALYAFVPDFEGDMRILGAALGSTAVTGQSAADVIDVTTRHRAPSFAECLRMSKYKLHKG